MFSPRVSTFSGLVIVFLVSLNFSEAKNFQVSWKIFSKADKLSNWASKMRFLIGDSLEIKYDPKADSVLEVTEDGYKTCNTSIPIKTYNDGDTKVVLDHSGPYYFISGAEQHCQKGQKMMVWVLSPKHTAKGHAPAISPSLATPPAVSPAPARSPVGLHSPAPAPSAGFRVNSGVALVVVSFIGLVLG